MKEFENKVGGHDNIDFVYDENLKVVAFGYFPKPPELMMPEVEEEPTADKLGAYLCENTEMGFSLSDEVTYPFSCVFKDLGEQLQLNLSFSEDASSINSGKYTFKRSE